METTKRMSQELAKQAAQEFLGIFDRPRVYKHTLQYTYSDELRAAKNALGLGLSEQKVAEMTHLHRAIIKLVAEAEAVPKLSHPEKRGTWALEIVTRAIQEVPEKLLPK